MHPWMIEQVASEHRRDLLARASRRRLVQGYLAGRRRGQPRPPGIRLVVPRPRPGLATPALSTPVAQAPAAALATPTLTPAALATPVAPVAARPAC